MEVEKLKEISDSRELLKVYCEQLELLGHENGFSGDAQKTNALLKKNFEKTSHRFQEVT